MTELIWALIVSIFAGAISGMGFGGGSILIVYLTAFLGLSQTVAQGINLLYFIPGAFVAIPIHAKHGDIKFLTAIYIILGGIAGALIGAFIALSINELILRKVFASAILLLGVWELFRK